MNELGGQKKYLITEVDRDNLVKLFQRMEYLYAAPAISTLMGLSEIIDQEFAPEPVNHPLNPDTGPGKIGTHRTPH